MPVFGAPVIPELPSPPVIRLPTRGRLLASLVYEAMLLAGILFAGTALFTLILQGMASGWSRAALQLWLATIAAVYFCAQWCVTGQTLPMKTWRLRVVGPDYLPVTAGRAVCRYVAALMGALLLGFGFVWMLFDPEHRYLHDRISGSRIINDG